MCAGNTFSDLIENADEKLQPLVMVKRTDETENRFALKTEPLEEFRVPFDRLELCGVHAVGHQPGTVGRYATRANLALHALTNRHDPIGVAEKIILQ